MKNQYCEMRKIFAVAPMLGWTDRHCRFFHRLLAPHALVYTEMIVANALIYGDSKKLLSFDSLEHPIALQIGGADPSTLAQAARIGEEAGYDEINFNVGCPSDRVQSGTFGACLMYDPVLVGECVDAIRRAVSIAVTVKCRISVDEQDSEVALDCLADSVFYARADAVWVHARKAWLKGLSPKENRDVPPLNHERVYRLKKRYPKHFIGINGGIESVSDVENHLRFTDGVMLGRSAYHKPFLLSEIDSYLQRQDPTPINYDSILETISVYAENHIAQGGRLSHITRHMIGLFHGFPGSAQYRRILSSSANEKNAGPEVLRSAFSHVFLHEDILSSFPYALSTVKNTLDTKQ